jgi:hypothetical protein
MSNDHKPTGRKDTNDVYEVELLPAVASEHACAVKTSFEERLIRGTLYTVVGIAMMMWCCLLPVWWYDILTLVPRIAWQQVHSVYHHGEPVMTDRLERALVFWPRGFLALLGIMNSRGRRPELMPETKSQLLMKTLFAIGFYSVLLFTSEVAKWCADAGFSLVGFGWYLLFAAVRATI